MDLTTLKYMPGTSGGKYFPFARKGNVLLGIQPSGAVDGSNYNLPGTTYFMYRLRSAPEGGLFAEEDAAKTVVNFQANPPNLWDAWPNVKKWEKRDNERASVTTGAFVKGRFSGGYGSAKTTTPELEELLGNIQDGKLGLIVAKGLMALAGEENLIVNKDELAAFIQAHSDEVVTRIKDKIEKNAKLHVLAQDSIGVFGVQTDLLAKVYEEAHPVPGEGDGTEGEDGTDPEDDENGED